MGRARLAFILLAVVACVAVGVLAATGSFSSAGKPAAAADGPSPACLPAQIKHSARLPGTAVDVSPAPETGTANPHTQVSFLGLPAAQIHNVSVTGQRSGAHSGHLEAYSQGDGASFVPDSPFLSGERVQVHAAIGAAAKPVAFSFAVDTPYPTASVPPFPNPTAPPSEYQTFRTAPGLQAPRLTVTVPDRDPAAGDIFTTNGPGPGTYGPLIYSPQGQLVWFEQLAGGRTAEDLSVQSYQGQPALTFWQGKVLSLGFGQGEDLVLNSHYQTIAKVPGGNGLQADLHEFQVAPREVAFITAYNPIRCDLASAEGSKDGTIVDTAIQEIDMKTGLVRWEWHSLDHVSVEESNAAAPSNSSPWDWFHLNSIDPEPDGNLFISARSTWAGYQLEGGTGKILWRLGGTESSFKMGPGTETAWQHDGRILPNGEVTYFDDGSNPPVHPQSRGVRIALDLKTHEARLTASYAQSPPLLAVSQGNMQTLPSGNSVVDFGAIPDIGEYAPDGSLLFDARLPLDMDSYRGFRHPWSGRPLTQPALTANLNNTSEQTIVHASWNGATEVASWRVLGGTASDSLKPGGIYPDNGFESEAIVAHKYAYVAVQALDSTGKVLATSPTVKVQSFEASFG